MMAFSHLKGILRVTGYAALLLAAPALLSHLPGGMEWGQVYAQEAKKEKPKAKRTQALDNKVYEALSKAQEAAEDKKYSDAITILNTLKNRKKPLNDFEMANALNIYAYVYFAKGDYDNALASYAKILTLEKAPEGMLLQTRYSLAQLYFATEQWQKGINALTEWFKVTESPGASAYMMLGQGYYQLKDYDRALQNVNKAIGMFKEKGKVPKENWYGLQRFLYYEKNDYKKVISILNEMLVYYPKASYWMMLSGMWGELKNEKKQLAAMEMVYIQGQMEKERDLVNLAYLFLANDVPYKAAKVLDEGIKAEQVKPTAKNLELLANAWHASQEIKKAIPEMAKAAAKSDKGELWARLGNIYLDNDDNKKAVDAIQAALKKGGLRRPDAARLSLGMAHFNLKQYESARKSFQVAKKDKRSEKYATQWLKYLNKELERQRSLQDV